MQRSLRLLIIIMFFIIFLRLCFLMILKNDFYYEKMISNTNVTINGTSAPRGRILDRYGRILVDNIGIKTIIYNKVSGIKNEDELSVAKELADILEINDRASDLVLRRYFYLLNKDVIDKRVSNNVIKRYKERKISSDDYLKEKYNLISDEEIYNLSINEKEAAIIYDLMSKGYSYMDKVIKTNCSDLEYVLINEANIPGVRAELSWERVYNYDDELKEILGSVSSSKVGIPFEEKEYYLSKGYNLNDRVGISYLEKEYEEYLKGKKAFTNSTVFSQHFKPQPSNTLFALLEILSR